MNYLAHLFLAKPTPDSHFGNLLGDFRKGIDIHQLPTEVKKALQNHYLVDKYTDCHPAVIEAKLCFSKEKRRFAGIAVDVLFDYFLIKHWQRYSITPHHDFKQQSYQLLIERHTDMPLRMQTVISSMVTNDWFETYTSLNGIGFALDRIASRIRFTNNFGGSLKEIEDNYERLEHAFLCFFPDLMNHVEQASLEK